MKECRVRKKSGRKKRMRLLAMLLTFCLMFTTCPEMLETLYVFATPGQEEKDTVYVAGFAELPEEVKEQTVSVGTDLDGLTLPDTLEASVILSDGENNAEDAGQEAEGEEPETGETDNEELETDDTQTEDVADDDVGQSGGTEEASDEEINDVQTEESAQDEGVPDESTDVADTQTDGSADAEEQGPQDTEEITAAEDTGNTENNGESLHSETCTVTMEEYYAENVITVETLTADNAQTKIVTITGVTWTSAPEYDGSAEGTYLFTAVLPEGYALMEGISLPQITVTLLENEEETEDTEVQALLDRIAALPDLEEYLAAEPDMDGDEDAYEEWLETLYAYAEEVPAIWEEYEALTEDRKAQIPEAEMAKLTAWVEFAETLADSMAVMTAATTVASGTCGSGVAWTLDSDGTLTISGSGAMTNFSGSTAAPWHDYEGDIKMVTIENGVTSIGSYAFCGCSSLTSITIPSGVTSIGTTAFYGCSLLTSIEIPSSVTSIGSEAFRGCSSLTSITIPSGVTSIGGFSFYECSSLESIEIPSGVTSIGMYAFYKCSKLTSITIPSGVTSIENYVFYGCSALESIEIPGSVTSIGNQAFYNCSALESIEIPENVTSIGNYAFRGCSSLESIEIPSGVTSIGSSTFYGCSSLENIKIPSGVTSIGDSAFYNCSSLESIEIPSGVTSIGNSTFCACSSLESIEIPSGVTSIGSSAFWGCSSLESIEIPSGVTSIGNAAFFNCYALALVIMEGTSPATLGTNVFKGCKFVTDSRKDLVVPAGTRDDYISATNWSSWAVYIHENHDDGEPMTAWTDSTSLPGVAGNYYLAADVTLGAEWTVPSGTTNLCLNGHTITFESGYIEIGSGNALYICDCDEQKRGSLSISNGGAYAVDNAGILGLSGSLTLTGTTADIHLGSGAYITVTDTLTGKFSIATANKPAVDAPVTITNSTTTAYNSTDNFTSADESYKIQKNSSGQLELAIPAYTVTLNGNGGNIGTTLTSYTYGIGATLPTDWTKTGYTFAGWYDNADCTGTEVTEISTTDTGVKKYWAKWIPVSYTITYSLDGGTTTGNPTSYTIESSAITLINPTKEGYTFTGWSGTDLTGSGNTSVTIASGSTGNREYTANWSANIYNVTLHENGGSSGMSLTSYTYGTGAVLPKDWKKTGYTFAGWYDNEGCTGTAVTEISTTAMGDKEYWAKWVDDIAPVIGDLSYSYKPKNLWHWLIGKDSLIITVPVTEEGSGADEITYTITPEGSAAEQKTAAIKNGTAMITLFADFQGTIAITCTDKDGNTSAGVTAGAALDSDGKGFLIEDNAPEITFAANNGASISSEYYDVAPDITVMVTDDADNAISAGIASIAYQIGNGEEITVNKDFAAQMVTECEFSIAADDIPTGEIKITITATDNAGNEASETITVKVKGPESKPAAAINYQTEMLTGLEPNADYTINGTVYQADTDGCIAIDDNWIGTTIELVRKGNGTETTDSEAQSISIPARTAQMPLPGAEDESGLDAGDGKLTGLDAGKAYQISTDNGATWKDVTADANGEIAGLAPGSYIVRIGSTDTDFASKPSAPVTIAAYLVTYTVTLHGNGGSGTVLASYTYGEGAVLPTDWTKTSYTFAGWYGNTYCTGTAVTAISATDTGDKEYWAKWNKKSSDSSDNGSDDSTDNSDNDTSDSDNTTDNSENDTGNFDNASGSGNKEQPQTSAVPDEQPDDKKEPPDERRDNMGSTQQEDEETQKQAELSGKTDTTNRIPEGETVQTVPVSIDGGMLALTGEPVETGNLTDTSQTTTVLMPGDGAVIVTVVCEDDHYTAGVRDTVAVANIVLTSEQFQLVYDGEVAEIRIDVTDISQTVGEQDKEVIEQGLEAWRQEIPELTLGMYVDISMFIKIGESDWDAITFTEEPIDIVIGIPEELQEDGREFYIIRSHEGEYTLLSDMDSEQDIITISTDSFSAYAIAYQQVDSAAEEVAAEETEENAKCGLCHICPTFLGLCCFIWLALVIVVTVVIVIIIMQKRKD